MDYNNKHVRDQYAKYLKGKRVVVVGPAPSIVGSKQKDIIDGYDVVVRLNKALPIPEHLKDDIGTRTDILYNCMNPSDECGGTISQSTLNNNNVKFLVSPYPYIDKMEKTKLPCKQHINDFIKVIKKQSHFSFCYYDDIKTFTKYWSIMKLPNTGNMAMLDLLKHDIKELYITGITFFKGGYYKDYRKYNEKQVMNYMKKFNLHKPEKAFEYMTNKLHNTPICKFDNALQTIINDSANSQPDNTNAYKNTPSVIEPVIAPASTDEKYPLHLLKLLCSVSVPLYDKAIMV